MSCRNKIPIVDLDNVFRDQLLRFMISPERVSEYLKQANDTLTAKEELFESLKRDFERVNRDCDVAFELYKSGGLTVQQFKEKYQPLDARKQEIAAELPRLQGELDVLRTTTLSDEYLTKELHGLHERWPKMGQEERRQIIEQIVTEKVVGSGQISIKFCHLPAFEQMTNGQRMVWRALPFCQGSIVAPLPPQPTRWKCAQEVPNKPQTIGDHIKARRIALHLFQRDVAKQIGVHVASIQNWERNVGVPMPGQIPEVLRFLGYVPFPIPSSRGQAFRRVRICCGWTQAELADAGACGESTIARWEQDEKADPEKWNLAIQTLKARLRSLGVFNLLGECIAALDEAL